MSPPKLSNVKSQKQDQLGYHGFLDLPKPFLRNSLERPVKRPRPCQHQCPIVLVHEAKRMHEFVHGHNQPVGKAGGVHEEQLLSPSHTKLT